MERQRIETEGGVATPARRGLDRPERRPGVPMEAEPRPDEGVHWRRPERQRGAERHLHHAGLDRPTPVVGTSVPPRGLSGLMRRGAYRIPEHYARHWLLLRLADRVDVAEDRLGERLARPLQRAGFRPGARVVRRNPLGVFAVSAASVAGLWLAWRMWR